MPPLPTLTTTELQTLSTRAISAKESSYCTPPPPPPLPSPHNKNPANTTLGPYSKFRVGACIITAAGEYIVGANVENVAYPVGTCAERVAFATAIVCPLPLPRPLAAFAWVLLELCFKHGFAAG